jgi:cyclopropane-fatty-acyl-phospholipid synthase
LIAPHTQILEIGCGWGGVAMYLAQHCGARVTGVTVKRQGVVPMTRNYIAAEERRLRAIDSSRHGALRLAGERARHKDRCDRVKPKRADKFISSHMAV